MTKTYTIDCSWQMYGHVDVEANSLTEAISKVENETELSNINAEYVSESFVCTHRVRASGAADYPDVNYLKPSYSQQMQDDLEPIE